MPPRVCDNSLEAFVFQTSKGPHGSKYSDETGLLIFCWHSQMNLNRKERTLSVYIIASYDIEDPPDEIIFQGVIRFTTRNEDLSHQNTYFWKLLDEKSVP